MLSILLTLVLLPPFGPADTEGRPVDTEERVVMARQMTGGMRIDGVLDEPDWQTLEPASDFLQYEPLEGESPSQRTEVRVVYGDQAVYVGAMLYDSEPHLIQPTLGRRDDFNQADWFLASIDSYLDRKSAYTFGVNAGGVQIDGVTTRELDTSWDAVWQSAVRRTPEGWVAELRIPLSMLRFSDGSETWGINFRRVIPRTSEVLEWALVPRTERSSGYVARYGTLQGLSELKSRRNIQILPYSVSRIDRREGEADGIDTSSQADFGVDLKVGLSSNWTLDATFNPDFGQVDADPAQLNLTAFETFFEERRPFFVEGADILSFSMSYDGSLLYTRRIGAGEPIITASKLSGRTERGLSVGILGAATGSDFSPGRTYGIVRARQEIGRYSRFGAVATGFARTTRGYETQSFLGGADWDIRLGDATYRLDGFATVARRNVEFEGIHQNGFALSTGFDKVRGVLTWGTSFRLYSDEFNPNDMGRLRRADFMRWSNDISYQIRGGKPFGPFKRGSIGSYFWQGWTYRDRLNTGAGFMLRGSLVTRGYQAISFRLEGQNLGEAYDLYETRGLGAFRMPQEIGYEASFETDSRRSWSLRPSINLKSGTDGGRSIRTGLKSEWNAGNRLRLSTSLGISTADNGLAWASNESFQLLDGAAHIGLESGAPGDAFVAIDASSLAPILVGADPYNSDDQYYLPVMGQRDTRSFDWSIRSNVTFSPKLSLQFYGQLFAARGHFDNYGLQIRPGEIVDFPDYPKQHDFSLASFQTNLVFRWEYRPGSALYLVWSQSRRDSRYLDPFDRISNSPFGDSAGSQISDVFNVFPANAFLVKLNYLFLR